MHGVTAACVTMRGQEKDRDLGSDILKSLHQPMPPLVSADTREKTSFSWSHVLSNATENV